MCKQILNKDIHLHNTRQKNNVHTIKYRTNLTQTNSNYINSKLYNKLPTEIKNITNMDQFLHKLKQFLLQKAYYSINEYLSDKFV